MSVRSAAKIPESLLQEAESLIPQGTFVPFQPYPAGDGDYIISLQIAQYLEPNQFDVIEVDDNDEELLQMLSIFVQ